MIFSLFFEIELFCNKGEKYNKSGEKIYYLNIQWELNIFPFILETIRLRISSMKPITTYVATYSVQLDDISY